MINADIDVNLTLPVHIKSHLMGCFKVSSLTHPDYHPIWNIETNVWLSKALNITTDCIIYNINNTFQVFFDWNNQIWFVG